MHRLLLIALAGLIASCAEDPARLMTWDDLESRPRPQPTETLRYRDGDAGLIDVWLPDGPGPHPVVVMIHGGCWQKEIADRTLMNYAAEALRNRGLAVWNIEYRGVDEPGGGYPGTFTDVAAAVDALRDAPERFKLSPQIVVAYGHSAGGHLAVWAATRGNLPEDSPLWSPDPHPIDVVVNAGGLADIAVSAVTTSPSCLADIRTQLVGDRPDALRDTSPAELLPPRSIVYNVNGARDGIAPPELGEAFTDAINSAAGASTFRLMADAGHVELIAPGTPAFEVQAQIIAAHAFAGN